MRFPLSSGEVKPIVHYTPTNGEYIELGQTAQIFGVQDHPRLGFERVVFTTKVVAVRENGEFETRNTIYKPVK